MFQPSLHDQASKKCYPLLVTGNNKSSLQTNSMNQRMDSSGVSSSSNSKTIGTLNNEAISNHLKGQNFGIQDHHGSSITNGSASSSVVTNGIPLVRNQSNFTSSPFNQLDTIPRPIATFEKQSINSREFATNVGSSSLGVFPLSVSSNISPSLRNSNILVNSQSAVPPAPSTMGNIITPNTKQEQSSSNTNQQDNSENGPRLHFCKKQHKEQTCAEFRSEPEFRVNDKTKHPPNTLFNVSIKDVLSITGYFLNDCEMFLRLDNGSQHGSPVGSCFFKPINPNSNMSDGSNRLFRAKIDIPPSLNTKKGNTSSRVGFVEIHDSNNKMIAVSDKFWIRSRSRNQMVKDESTKKRIRMNQKSDNQKQQKIFHDYSPTSPQSETTHPDAAQLEEEDIVTGPPSKKPLSIPQQHANPLSGAPSSMMAISSSNSELGNISGGMGFNYEQKIQNAPPMTSFSNATTSLLQQQQQVANDFSSLGNLNVDFWNVRNTPDITQSSSFSFLDREMSNASNSRAPTTSNLLTPSSWSNQAGEPLKTLENLVRNQQQRIEELSCLIANNAKLIHTLQMHILSLTNPINSEP